MSDLVCGSHLHRSAARWSLPGFAAPRSRGTAELLERPCLQCLLLCKSPPTRLPAMCHPPHTLTPPCPGACPTSHLHPYRTTPAFRPSWGLTLGRPSWSPSSASCCRSTPAQTTPSHRPARCLERTATGPLFMKCTAIDWEWGRRRFKVIYSLQSVLHTTCHHLLSSLGYLLPPISACLPPSLPPHPSFPPVQIAFSGELHITSSQVCFVVSSDKSVEPVKLQLAAIKGVRKLAAADGEQAGAEGCSWFVTLWLGQASQGAVLCKAGSKWHGWLSGNALPAPRPLSPGAAELFLLGAKPRDKVSQLAEITSA